MLCLANNEFEFAQTYLMHIWVQVAKLLGWALFFSLQDYYSLMSQHNVSDCY